MLIELNNETDEEEVRSLLVMKKKKNKSIVCIMMLIVLIQKESTRSPIRIGEMKSLWNIDLSLVNILFYLIIELIIL